MVSVPGEEEPDADAKLQALQTTPNDVAKLEWRHVFDAGQTIRDSAYVVNAAFLTTIETGYLGSFFAEGIWLFALGADGDLQWETTYADVVDRAALDPAVEPPTQTRKPPGQRQLVGTAASQSRDGGVVLGGDPGVVVKTDSEGSLVWQTPLRDGSTADAFRLVPVAITQTPDDGYIVAVSKEPWRFSDEYTRIPMLIKLAGDGRVDWRREYDFDTVFYSVTVVGDGDIVVAGGGPSETPDKGGDATVLKTDTQGQVVWSRSSGAVPPADLVFGWADGWETADGGYVTVGNFTLGHSRVMKLTATGTVDWEFELSDTMVWTGQPTADAGLVLTGITALEDNPQTTLLKLTV